MDKSRKELGKEYEGQFRAIKLIAFTHTLQQIESHFVDVRKVYYCIYFPQQMIVGY